MFFVMTLMMPFTPDAQCRFTRPGPLSTCSTHSQAATDAITAITALYSAGIKVYVIGLGAGVDASTNPVFAPVHMYHVGVWFNSAKASAAAGCANTVTPFNGEHTAGPQALSTRQYSDTHGPLRKIKS